MGKKRAIPNGKACSVCGAQRMGCRHLAAPLVDLVPSDPKKNPHGVREGQEWRSNDIRQDHYDDKAYQPKPFRVVAVNEATGKVTVTDLEGKNERTLKLENFGIKAKKGYTLQ